MKSITKTNTNLNNFMSKSRIISKDIVFQSKTFRIEKTKYNREGKIFIKDIIIRSPHVIIIPLTDNNEIYLASEFRDIYQEEKLELIAGYMEDDEDPLDAAKRELKEEGGLTAGKWTLLGTKHTSANMDSKVHIFLAEEIKEGGQTLDEDEQISLTKVPLGVAVDKVVNGEIDIFSYIATILLFDKLKKEDRV